jgi:cell wall assembly regulator SMI1
MSPDTLRRSLEDLQSKLSSRNYDVRSLVLEAAASEDEVAQLEGKLGFPVPPKFRRLLLEVSHHVEFRWFAPDGTDYPEPFESNFSGDLHWSLEFAGQFNSDKDSWITEVFPNSNDPYDAIWHDKFAFYEVGNGDYLSIDLSPEKYEQIVYLSHDGGEGHGHVLAQDIFDLLDRWIPLGCTGGEDWQWLPFTDDKKGPIDPSSDIADRWKWLLGLEI